MASRMPKSDKTTRMHVQMPNDWKASIAKAAKRLNVSISSFVAKAARDAAIKTSK
jgi:uncharacterized protein (DUF1778 family)